MNPAINAAGLLAVTSSKQVHRAPCEHEAREDRGVVGAETLAEATEEEREETVHRLDGVFRISRPKGACCSGRKDGSPGPT